MKQQFVKTTSGLISAAVKAIIGATVKGEEIGLFHGSAAKFTIDLNALVAARDSYELGRMTLRECRASLEVKTMECREKIRLTRDVLKQYLGLEYSRQWDITGMVGSLGISKIPEELLPLLLGFKAQLGANPAQENPMLNITAVHMETLCQQLSDAIGAVISQEAVVSDLLDFRNQKAEALYKRLRICVEELTLLIDPMDTRWSLFGFNTPGAQKTPQAPEQIEVVIVNETTAMIEIPPTPLAEYYRVYKRVVGVDVEPIAMGSPTDPDFMLEDLPRNATIEFSASAVNNGGESVRSKVVTVATV